MLSRTPPTPAATGAQITTVDGETGTDYVTAPAGLTAAVVTTSYGIVRKNLGTLVGYARFDGGPSEPVYADTTGLHRLSTASTSNPTGDLDVELAVVSARES